MREAWALRDAQSDIGDQRSAISEEISDKPAPPQGLAARLAAIRQGREVEEHDIAQRLERLHDKELEQEHEAKVRREREPGHEL